MRSKQVQILSGICGVQLIGYACRAAGFKTDIWIGFAGSVFLMLDIVYLAIQEKGRKKCPECDSEISKKVRIFAKSPRTLCRILTVRMYIRRLRAKQLITAE